MTSSAMTNRRRSRLGIVAWGVAVCTAAMLLSSAPAVAEGRIVIDDLGSKVLVKQNIRRIVSLVPTNSEMVCLLDCERLKGGTRYDEFPEELKQRFNQKQIETIGGGFDVNLEKIVRLQPDLILINGPSQQRFAVPLRNMGYAVLSLWPRDVTGLSKDFVLLGQLLDREDRAKRMLDAMQKKLIEIETKANNQRKRRVYLQMWSNPLITVGKSSFTDWLVSAAGGINVFGDMAFDSGQISLESLIRRNPEVLIFLAGQEPFARSIQSRPGWSAISGVQQRHFCFLQEPDIRRSIQFVDGLAKIHDCLFNETRARREAQ